MGRRDGRPLRSWQRRLGDDPYFLIWGESNLAAAINGGGARDTGMRIVIHSSEGSRSHAKPMLEIGEILLERTHAVTYVASQEKLVYAEGYRVQTHSLGSFGPPDPAYKRNLQAMGKTPHGIVQLVSGLLLTDYPRVVRGLGEYLDRFGCDLLICDFAAGACSDLAQERGIPLVIGLQAVDVFGLVAAPYVTKTMGYGPVTTKGLSLAERFHYQVLEPLRMLRFMVPLQRIVAKAKAGAGFRPKPTLLGDFTYGLGLANTYVGFEPAMALPPNIRLVGPVLSRARARLDRRTKTFLDNHGRTMYISTGTNVVLEPATFASVLNATSQAIAQGLIDGAIWAIPNAHLASYHSPPNPHLLMAEWAPQQAILAHASTRLHLSHCGLESTFESIVAATPVIAMPFFGDQPRNAAKLVTLGIARFVTPDASPDALVASMRHLLLSPTIATHLQHAQRVAEIASRGKSLAASIVEDHAALALACRPLQPYDPRGPLPPCEMRHVVPDAELMSPMAANLWDMQLLLLLAFALVLNGIWARLSRTRVRPTQDKSH